MFLHLVVIVEIDPNIVINLKLIYLVFKIIKIMNVYGLMNHVKLKHVMMHHNIQIVYLGKMIIVV